MSPVAKKESGTGDSSPTQTKSSFKALLDNAIVKWIVTSIFGLFIAAGTYYIKTEYVPRKEIEEKYVLRKDFENELTSIENTQKLFVNKEVYETRMEAIKESLSRIERALEENNRVLREVIEKASRGNN